MMIPGWQSEIYMKGKDSEQGVFILIKELEYLDGRDHLWVIPKGTESNLSNFPFFVRTFVPVTSLIKSPFLHDYLYGEQPIDSSTGKTVTRKTADRLYKEGAVHEGHMSKFQAWRFYTGLRLGGWRAFNKCKREIVKRGSQKH